MLPKINKNKSNCILWFHSKWRKERMKGEKVGLKLIFFNSIFSERSLTLII